MKLSSPIILVFFFTLTNCAQKKETIYLWKNKVPGEIRPKQKPSQNIDTIVNVTRLTEVTNPALIVFKPKSSINNGVGIIVCPGGGYGILAIDLEGYEIAEWLTKLGYTAFVLQYRIPNKRDKAIYDIQRAIRVVRNKASEYNLKTNKLGVLGFSAGGSLSARASTRFHLNYYPKTDTIDSISSRPNFTLLIYPAYLDEGENSKLTPELTITKETPPMFIFGTADDWYANSTLVMATALRDCKIPVELHLLQDGGHGYGLRSGNNAAETWPSLAANWLQKEILKN